MREPGQKTERVSITYFEGVNSTVQHAIARRTELAHMENARAPIIGVLEKREGQQVLGTDPDGNTFTTTGNYGLVYFANLGNNQGLFRLSSTPDSDGVSILVLDPDDHWQELSDDDAHDLSSVQADFSNVDGKLVIVNGTDDNRMLDSDGETITTSSEIGSLWNSPPANKTSFYKSRIYLADYTVHNNRLKTTVLRSSYPMGIISLLNGDVPADTAGTWVLPVTDSKYFYTDSGMNEYEVYRGSQKVADLTISNFTETDISSTSVTFSGAFTGFLSADEIWIAGTYTGEKQYRWINNASTIGRDVKQYDTFKLVGGDEDEITLFEPIGNIMLIANKNTMMTWNDYNLENFDLGIGCSAKNGWVKLRGSLYFIHTSGIYSTTGTTPQLISRKVERYIKGATKAGIENSAAGFKGLSVFFTLGDVTLYNNDGSFWKILPGCCLEFNVADQNWYVHTNVTASEFETFIANSGAERLAAAALTESTPPVLGPELLINGTFSGSSSPWDLGDGWTYLNGEVIFVSGD